MFTSIVGALKAVPALVRIVEEFISLWILWQEKQIDDAIKDAQEERKAILSLLRKEVSDEERRRLRILLHRNLYPNK